MPAVIKKINHQSNGSVKVKGLERLREATPAKVVKGHKESLWTGPCGTGPNGGISQSLIGNWLCDRERFRVKTIDGLKEQDKFNHRLEFGNMWHICEEIHASNDMFIQPLTDYCKQLVKRYGASASKEILHWYNVCKAQFPIYVDHWKKHVDEKNRKPIEQEQVFDIPYKLPSNRIIRLRGKRDSADIIGKGLFIKENKTKGELDVEALLSNVRFDLQSNFYLTAAWYDEELKRKIGKTPILGIRYNIVRRPLSGGKHSISQRKGKGKAKTGAETEEEFYKRLRDEEIKADPGHFFMRMKIEITREDLNDFNKRCLLPILENIADDYEWWNFCKLRDESQFNYWLRQEQFPQHVNRHFMMPFGVYSPLLEGRSTTLDNYILSGTTKGLEKASTLFSELQ